VQNVQPWEWPMGAISRYSHTERGFLHQFQMSRQSEASGYSKEPQHCAHSGPTSTNTVHFEAGQEVDPDTIQSTQLYLVDGLSNLYPL
jgi:hypothetical protein